MGKPVDDQVIASQCVNPRFTVLVRPYLFGQFRIQICDRAQPDPHAPEWGSIVHELYTYCNREGLARIIAMLQSPLETKRLEAMHASEWPDSKQLL